MLRVSLFGVFLVLGLLCGSNAWFEWFWRLNSTKPPDPEVFMNATELITSKGYPCEEHYVTTADGFILGLQRIPHGRNETAIPGGAGTNRNGSGQNTVRPRPVVFLQHGLLCSSTNWLTNLENQSFAYLLADAGFDVWLGNVRGNVYSMGHTNLSPKSDEFWAWSWDEMAEFDLPAMVDYALAVSGREQLYYVGHSQGSTMAFAGLSVNKELEKKIKMFFALGPVTTVSNMTSPLRYMAPFVSEIKFLLNIFGVRDFMPSTKVTSWLASDFCSSSSALWCENIVFVLCGFDSTNLNETRMPVYFSHSPSGTSVQDMIHFAQMVSSGKFQKFDYGSDNQNMAHYNQTMPPVYYPKKISTPTVLYWGGQDWLADPTDVRSLIPKLTNLVESVYIPEYDHLDFIWGTDSPYWVYEPIIETIRLEEASGHFDHRAAKKMEEVAIDEVEDDVKEEDGENKVVEDVEDGDRSSYSSAILEYIKMIEEKNKP